ncbi:AAA family ATPase (plasmid) [Rhizobium johnstonii]|nr:AAA family ATPase [Rhizobium johnstonii]
MKLIKAHVTHYRNIVDSNEVDIARATCLVGKNEAGKTAFLKALEGLRSTDTTYKAYNKIENYPRRHLADYEQTHDGGQAQVVTTKWELDPADVAAVEAVLGHGVLTGGVISVGKSYGQEGSTWIVPISQCCSPQEPV